jgi:lipopolysaccharide export LptBFGC system permease protein LptF
MIKTLDQYLVKQLALATLIATVVFSGPVILISLFSHLPGEDFFTELLWPSLSSIAPMILYQILPVLVAGAIVCCYGRFSSEGVLVTLHLAGQSIFRVRAPALFVATSATVVGYAMSCLIAPLTAGHLHDVLHFVRHDINPAMLRAGQLNDVDGGRVTIYFKNFLNKNEISTVFIREVGAENEEKVYVARRAVFERNAEQNGIVLFDGSIQEFKPSKGEVTTANFDRLSRPLITFGATNSKRPYIIVDELSTPSLLRERVNAFNDLVEARSWTREAVKRFGIPVLTIVHTLLGLEFLALWGIMTDRRRQPVLLACGIIASIHFMVVIAAEQIGLDLRWAWAVPAIVAAELAAAVALMTIRPQEIAWPLRSIAPRAYGLLEQVRGALRSALSGDYIGAVVGPGVLAHASGEHGIGRHLDDAEAVDVSGGADHQALADIFVDEYHHPLAPAVTDSTLDKVNAPDMPRSLQPQPNA